MAREGSEERRMEERGESLGDKHMDRASWLAQSEKHVDFWEVNMAAGGGIPLGFLDHMRDIFGNVTTPPNDSTRIRQKMMKVKGKVALEGRKK